MKDKLKRRQTTSQTDKLVKEKSVTKETKENDNDVRIPNTAQQLYIQPKFGPMPSFPNQRIFARVVMILATLIIVYFTSSGEKEIVFAKQRDFVPGRGQNVECSAEYTKELNDYPDCVPEKCGRYVADRLVSEAEAEQLLDIGKRGLALGSTDSGVAILDLHSGAVSKGQRFVNIYALDNISQLFSMQDFAVYRIVKTKIQHAVAHHFGVPADILYLTHPTFFSQLTDKPAVTAHDEYWHPHVDKETYPSFHYTSLLYLSDFNVDFQGGRFFFREPDNSTVVIEPRKGRVSMFTSGKENLHHIEPVKSGARYALTVSFTCDKKFAISDPTIPNTS